MEGLFEPSHLIFILIIVLILFGPGKLPDSQSFRCASFLQRRQWNNLVRANRSANSFGFLCLLAILIGNTLYFIFASFLPPAAQMGTASSSGLPALVDLWFCFFVFGVLNLLALLRGRNEPEK